MIPCTDEDNNKQINAEKAELVFPGVNLMQNWQKGAEYTESLGAKEGSVI
jgi:hypothetical protein